MNKVLLLLVAVFGFSQFSYAQLPSGSLAPNFTTVDIHGNSHTLYNYLNQGYTVVLDVSATWCQPCWNYHTSGALSTLHYTHGVANGGNVIVMFIEGDPATGINQLNGTGGNTRGNWVANTPYIITDDAAAANLLQVNYFPTVYVVCPTGIITETGTLSANGLWNFINTNSCQSVPSTDAALMEYNGPTVSCSSANASVKLANLGSSNLTSATITVAGVTPTVTQNWTGNLGRFESTVVNLGTLNLTGDVVVSVAPDGNNSNNSVAGTRLAAQSTTHLRFDIKFDNWPQETSWELRNENNQIVHQGGPYTPASGYPPNSTLMFDRFVPSSGCYTLVVKDSYGDGMRGSQWGSQYQDGRFRVYSIQNGQVYSDIYTYLGNYDFEQDFGGANISETVSVEELDSNVFTRLYPNPASDLVNVSYGLIGTTDVRMEIVNMVGAKVLDRYIGRQSAGSYLEQVDSSMLPAGLYLINLYQDGVPTTLRLTVSK